jgi:hypothetical protein
MGVLRGLVSAYSQNEVAGTKQRFRLPGQSRQYRLETLRMFVTGAPPYRGGPGIPQRAMTSSRSPSVPARRHLVGEDSRKQRQIARAVLPCAKPVPNRRLAFDLFAPAEC